MESFYINNSYTFSFLYDTFNSRLSNSHQNMKLVFFQVKMNRRMFFFLILDTFFIFRLINLNISLFILFVNHNLLLKKLLLLYLYLNQ